MASDLSTSQTSNIDSSSQPTYPLTVSETADTGQSTDQPFRLPNIRSKLMVLLQAGLLVALFGALFAIVQYGTPALIGTDGYYHIKMGYLIRQQGLTPEFNALPLTILNNESFYDLHLLYHVYLALFASTDPAFDGGLALTQGAKIASIVLPSLAFLAVWWLLRRRNVPWAALWALALFGVSEAFLYRMSMPRAQSGSLLLLALGMILLLEDRYKWLLPLGFVYVWFYNAFPLLLLMSGLYVGATLLTERRLAWQALLYPTLGVVLGLVINPYFPEDISLIVGQYLPKIGESTTRVGTEWSAYRTDTLLRNSAVALGAAVLGVLALGWRQDRVDKSTLLAFGLMVVFGFMLFRSRRFVEYFPAFALIFLALSAAPLLRDGQQALASKQRPYRYLAPLLFLVLLTYPIYKGLVDARELVSSSKPADQYAAASLWLKANSEPDIMIFQTDWDDFTRLFFYNSEATYTAGLDPTFMELFDKELFDLWRDITQGDVDMPGALIRDRFKADYVFSDLRHGDFLEQAADDPILEEIYRDEYAAIFRVN